MAEVKLAGILFLQLFLYERINFPNLIEYFEDPFAKKTILDWNICDRLCGKVLGLIIQFYELPCAGSILRWENVSHLWQTGVSIVPFVHQMDKKELYKEVLSTCSILIKREERFAKTAVGRLLRELAKYDWKTVNLFFRRIFIILPLKLLKMRINVRVSSKKKDGLINSNHLNKNVPCRNLLLSYLTN